MSTRNRNAAIRNMKTITTLVEPISSLRLVQLTFFISLSVAMRKSTLAGLLVIRQTSAANSTKNVTATNRAMWRALAWLAGVGPRWISAGSQAYRWYAVRPPRRAAARA